MYRKVLVSYSCMHGNQTCSFVLAAIKNNGFKLSWNEN